MTAIIAASLVIVGALLLVGAVVYAVIIYNGLVTVKNNIDKAWSNIDVLLKQRQDELPKLVTICERYMLHEAETLEKVIKARAMAINARGVGEKGKTEGMLTEALKSLFALAENYPNLKADGRFARLQGRVSALENEIADRRELFNESVNTYNIRIRQVPDVFIAAPLGYRQRELWQINPGDRKDVNITFSH